MLLKFLIFNLCFSEHLFKCLFSRKHPFKSSHIKNKSDLKFAKNEMKKGDEYFNNARNALYQFESISDFFEKALYHYFWLTKLIRATLN